MNPQERPGAPALRHTETTITATAGVGVCRQRRRPNGVNHQQTGGRLQVTIHTFVEIAAAKKIVFRRPERGAEGHDRIDRVTQRLVTVQILAAS